MSEPAYFEFQDLDPDWLDRENLKAMRELPPYEGDAKGEIGSICNIVILTGEVGSVL